MNRSPFLISAAVSLFLCAGAARAAELEVVVHKVAQAKGAVRVALYADAASFRKEDKALLVQSVAAQAGSIRTVFSNLAAGRYAVIVYHDENDNKKLDLILGMIPDEGYGLSNNPKVSGPPQFAASAFDLADPESKRIDIDLAY